MTSHVRSLAIALTLFLCGLVPEASAQTAPSAQPLQLMARDLPQMPGKVVEVYLIERGPQQGNDPHMHPTASVFGYVLEGEYEFQVRGGPLRTLKAGEMFYEAPGDIHQVSRNPSKTQPVKFLVFFVKDKDVPRTVPVK
jgi:quercetin dioxygenase-like cupin family protein